MNRTIEEVFGNATIDCEAGLIYEYDDEDELICVSSLWEFLQRWDGISNIGFAFVRVESVDDANYE